jgi:hypothetical protein
MERLMARHRAGLGGEKWILPALGVFAVLGLLVAGILAVVVESSSGSTEQVAGSSCTGPIRVVTASSFAPVFDGIATELDHGANCVRLDVDTADGRKAIQRVADDDADVWVPDDDSWVGSAGTLQLAQAPTAGAGTVLATSPIYMVTDKPTAAKLGQAGGSWSALAGMVDKSQAKLVINGPNDSGDGLVGIGDAAEAVWLGKDMDASALWLDSAKSKTRTVGGNQPAMPAKAGEVGLVAERALLPALAEAKTKDLTALPGTDYSAMLRYTWLPTANALGNPTRAAALERVRAKLTDPAVVGRYLKAASLRLPGGVVPAGGAASLPKLTAKPFGVLEAHHIDHVFATWYPEDRRTNLLVVVDVSGSMAGKTAGSGDSRIDLVRQGSRSLEGLLPDDSQMGLWQFGSKLDGDRDWQQLVGIQPLDSRQRDSLGGAIDSLAAQPTGTGLYDTVLAAYTSARDAYRAGVPNQVVVFTDGKNESDANSMTAAQLAASLKKAADPKRPVLLSVVTFGTAADAKVVNDAVVPVQGYVDNLTSASEVAAVFIHVAAGGLQH